MLMNCCCTPPVCSPPVCGVALPTTLHCTISLYIFAHYYPTSGALTYDATNRWWRGCLPPPAGAPAPYSFSPIWVTFPCTAAGAVGGDAAWPTIQFVGIIPMGGTCYRPVPASCSDTPNVTDQTGWVLQSKSCSPFSVSLTNLTSTVGGCAGVQLLTDNSTCTISL